MHLYVFHFQYVLKNLHLTYYFYVHAKYAVKLVYILVDVNAIKNVMIFP